LLLGVDERATIPHLVAYVATLGAQGRAVARVVHVIEHAVQGGLALETFEEASSLVEETVFELRMAGIGANGTVRRARLRRIGPSLVQEASRWSADAIVLMGPRRRLFGWGVREQVLRGSGATTVLVSGQPRTWQSRLGHDKRAHGTIR
jgi:nucleotide-binding universal stress UspA family protein